MVLSARLGIVRRNSSLISRYWQTGAFCAGPVNVPRMVRSRLNGKIVPVNVTRSPTFQPKRCIIFTGINTPLTSARNAARSAAFVVGYSGSVPAKSGSAPMTIIGSRGCL